MENDVSGKTETAVWQHTHTHTHTHKQLCCLPLLSHWFPTIDDSLTDSAGGAALLSPDMMLCGTTLTLVPSACLSSKWCFMFNSSEEVTSSTCSPGHHRPAQTLHLWTSPPPPHFSSSLSQIRGVDSFWAWQADGHTHPMLWRPNCAEGRKWAWVWTPQNNVVDQHDEGDCCGAITCPMESRLLWLVCKNTYEISAEGGGGEGEGGGSGGGESAEHFWSLRGKLCSSRIQYNWSQWWVLLQT